MNLPMLAYSALAAVGIAAATGVMAYRSGYDAAVTRAQAEQAAHLRRAQAEQAAHLRRAIAEAEAIAAQDREIYAAGDARVARVQRVFQTIDREVIRYVQAHPLAVECLDADGLRLWAAANAGTEPDAAGDGGDAGPLPGDAAAAQGHDRPDAAGGPRGAGAAVSPAPGRGADLGGVDAGGQFWRWLEQERLRADIERTAKLRPHWGWR